MFRGQKFWVSIVIWAVVIGFAAGGVIFFTPGGLQIFNQNPQQQQEPALVVNGEEISPGELEIAYQNLLNQYRQLYQQFGQNFDDQLQGANGARYQLQLRNQAADQLIRQKLLDQEARKRRISVPRTQVDVQFRDQYEQFLANNQLTEEQLIELLKDPQIRERFRQIFNLNRGTLAEFKAKLRREVEAGLKREKLQDVVVGEIEPTDLELLDYVEQNAERYRSQIIAPVVPTDEELKAYFEEHRDRYAKDEVRVRHIFLAVPPDAPEEAVQSASQKIEAIYQELQAGGDFEALMERYGGEELGWIARGQSPYGSQFEDAAFALNKGEISKPVRTDSGFHIIQVLDVRTTGFEDVKEQVKQDYTREKEQERFEAWLKEAKEKGVFPELEEVHARHILIRVAQDAPEDEVQSAYKKALDIREQLLQGADFAELAEKYSDDPGSKLNGGDLGWFGHGRMVPEFDQAAFSLGINEISEPVRTQFGFHIIQTLEKRTTDDFKQQIREAYVSEQKRKEFEGWVSELVDKAQIEVKDPLLAAYRLEDQALQAQDSDEKLRLLDEAIAAYQQAIEEFVEDPYVGYYQSRLYKEKLDLLKQKLEELGEDASAEEREALQKQIEEARQKAVETFLSVTAYGSRDEFLFQDMLELAPENADLRYAYARFLLEQGDEQRAYEQLQKTLEVDPGYWRARLLAASLQSDKGEYASAIAYLEEALKQIPEGSRDRYDTQLKLARAYLEQARVSTADRDASLQKAEEAVKELLQALPEGGTGQDRLRAEALALLGDIAMERGDSAPAIDAYKQSLSLRNLSAVEAKLGQAYLANGQLDRAKTAFESVVTRDPYSVIAREGLGDVYRTEGDIEKALEYYREALDLRSDFDTRKRIAQKILELDPEDLDTRFKLAQLHMNERLYSSAIDQYNAILEFDPESWQAYRGLGEAYLGRTEYERAKDAFKSALLLDPPTGQKVVLYEKILEAERDLVGPEGKLGKDGQEALLKLAELYLQQGLTAKARENLETLQSDYPDYQPEKVQELLNQLEGGSGSSKSESSEDGG